MLRLLNIEELQRALAVIPDLILMFEKKDTSFFNSVKDWLKHLESILEKNKLNACSEIALLRGTLISVERGMLPEKIVFTNRKSPKKVMDAAAVEALKKANEVLLGIINGSLTQINEAERLIRQVIPLAERKGFFISSLVIPDYSENLRESWKKILVDPDLAAVGLHIKGLVSLQDILILLDRNYNNLS